MERWSELMRPMEYSQVIGNKEAIHMLVKSTGSSLLWGPTGCGKSTIARLYGKGAPVYNAVALDKDAIRGIAYRGGTVIIDEFHRLQKAMQEMFLVPCESGHLTVVATTTENPYGFLVSGLLSRFRLLKIERPTSEEMLSLANNLCEKGKLQIPANVLTHIVQNSNGVRKMIDTIEDVVNAADGRPITSELYKAMHFFSVSENSTESLKSALQKSIRGSDPDASALYAWNLCAQGDLESVCRRLRVIACEDIGLAAPSAVGVVNACIDSAQHLGMPEAAYPIIEAAIYLATRPKSNSVAKAIRASENAPLFKVPRHIRFEKCEDYKYPHDYPNHWVKQQYMPYSGKVYEYGDNTTEQKTKEYWDKIKGE